MTEATDSGSGQKIPPKIVMGAQNGNGDGIPAVPKKETSRISLDAAVRQQTSEMPKTIRLKPAAGIQERVSRAGIVVPPIPATPPDTSSAEKRKTSRISLEAALAPDSGSEGGPKTIRLKKPSEAATVRVGQNKAAGKGDTSAIEAKGNPGQTSELPKNMEAEGPSTTQRKTIRIKRTEGARGIDLKTSIARSEKGEGGAGMRATDIPHVMFLVSAIAASLVLCVLIYSLTAQAFGPNVSLTQLSYGAPSMDLAWPGKVGPSK